MRGSGAAYRAIVSLGLRKSQGARLVERGLCQNLVNELAADFLAFCQGRFVHRLDGRFRAAVPDEIEFKFEFEVEDDGTELELELRW